MRLAAQARKYGLGLVLATQNPKDLDYQAVAQFSTQFFGKANSPQVIEFIQRLLAEKGGAGDDVGRLQRGQFYVASEGIQYRRHSGTNSNKRPHLPLLSPRRASSDRSRNPDQSSK